MSAVLVVCTANVFRSPLAAGLLAARVGGTFSSAGVRARPGEPMAEAARSALAAHGLADDGFRSRRLTAELVADAAAVVTMTWAELSETVRLSPRALRKVVTLGEVARAASDGGARGFEDLVAAAVCDRGTVTVQDVPDPRDARLFAATTARITELVDVVAGALAAGVAGAR
ncbi:hypothetical protein Amsp01_050520 [Amycolatopsis sp. NBRC 101858]|uniref:arsenate reductase/protein-tyrosine-phosphatase family protein n=1 Tax=Amycolatopsis sp. NBRC 101858 TaxID=3032200 RepID=UPI00249FE917|nr:hypothetical protein [Amycolatopsis sp. NBRC 101858]GLY39028.1 hypothetical protein Amsp01_050520 [Amycolatopsis sp. NBRC 101858]